jgi:hypothetical protein
VTYLLKQAGELQVGGDSLEHIMLRIDFRIMKACYGLTRRFSEARSRAALQEMSEIVGHFANAFGEQLASSARV